MRLACLAAVALVAASAATPIALGAPSPERLVMKPYPGGAWKRITDQASGGAWDHEQIPAGQTANNFTEILTDQAFPQNKGVDPSAFLRTVFGGVGNACSAVTVNGPKAGVEGGHSIAYAQIYCGQQKGQPFGAHIFYKVIQGDAALYVINMERHVPPSTVPGQLAFPKGHEADAAAMLKAESAANSYLVNSVYLCGGRTVDPRCGK